MPRAPIAVAVVLSLGSLAQVAQAATWDQARKVVDLIAQAKRAAPTNPLSSYLPLAQSTSRSSVYAFGRRFAATQKTTLRFNGSSAIISKQTIVPGLRGGKVLDVRIYTTPADSRMATRHIAATFADHQLRLPRVAKALRLPPPK